MWRLFVVTACALMVVLGVALAGDMPKEAASVGAKAQVGSAEQMKAMTEAMMNCYVCKHMASHMDELGPVMTMEVAKLNNGVAVMHTITDPAKVAAFHAVGKKMSAAGQECFDWTDEQAKAELCPFCQEIRSVVKAGANMSTGDTKTGDIMVWTSNDPVVQAKISTLGEKCAVMEAAM